MTGVPRTSPASNRDVLLNRFSVFALVAYLLITLAVALGLTGCASTLSGSPSVSAQRTVYSAENDFTIALELAVTYEALPQCSATVKFPCSDPSTVSKVTAAARAARVSLATAEAAVRSNTNAAAMTTAALQAESDVAAFQALAGALSK